MVWLATVPASPVLAQSPAMLDDFEELRGWTTVAAPGAQVDIAQDVGHQGKGLRINFDFRQGGGFIIVHKTFAIPLPENYAFRFLLRAEAPRNNFEFRLVDSSRQNVWWHRKPEFSFPAQWQEIIVKRHNLEFAWGPAAGGAMQAVSTVEFALSVAEGGKGSIWIDDLSFEPRAPVRPYTLAPVISASSSASGHEPAHALDRDPTSRWKSSSHGEAQWLCIDFREDREYGGVVIDWDEHDYATAYQVQVSGDGRAWRPLHTVTSGNGGRDYLYLPEAESRYLRLDLQRSSRRQGYAIRNVTVKPHEFSASPNDFFGKIAGDAPRGFYPKYLYGEQSYWTIVGVKGDDKEALLNEEGMLEVEKRAFSLEPFLYADGKLITWNDVRTAQELERGYLPIPSVTWRQDRLMLKVTTLATGEPGASTLYARYQISNTGAVPQRVSLFLAIRPFQVNPPWQSLNMVGGVGRIGELRVEGHTVWVNRDQAVVSLNFPDHVGAATFDTGPITDFLAEGRVPGERQVSDPLGYASSALHYSLALAPGGMQEVYVAIPFHEPHRVQRNLHAAGLDPASLWRREYETATRYWEATLNRAEIRLPAGQVRITNTLKSTLAYILINRDGPALRPGSRCYARSWIRDGALTSSALLEMGLAREVRDFIAWYARYQSVDGRIPCCLDPWGPDTMVEHDSEGEFIYAVAEYYRHTHDVAFLREMWPPLIKAVEYMGSLREQRLTEAYRTEDKLQLYGLMPESASHEGYSAHPVHSYWDDFWALRGLKDAAAIATALGETGHAARFAALRDGFRKDLYASIGRTQSRHGIDYLPGSVELGDFDPASTAIALSPGEAQQDLPEAPLIRTFDMYAENFRRRTKADIPWSAYSPYELRIIGALVRMGQRVAALEALDFFLKDRRPAAWNQWAEVIWRDRQAPKFIGDMPHTWVGSEYIRALRSLFVYERESDRALVIGAGLPREWIESDRGVSVQCLPTHYGLLSYELHGNRLGETRLSLSGTLTMPPGKIILDLPYGRPIQAVQVNGKAVQSFDGHRVILSEFPAEVNIR